ncbi:site-specific integrase [Gemmatimonas sp.]|uniref:site-specific integrase n=1 Tax=Gemmatimonas sp. TaxID=1962908 RepID=UPI0022C2FA30|nr:site-specific integrase [Gemmatimonas sp.]MCZ8205237.1 site-specific integrase [Gemmatimonas sp.]
MPKIARQAISKRVLDAAKLQAAREGRRVRLWDVEPKGLGARVHPTGTVTWFVRYARPEGGEKRWQTYSLTASTDRTDERVDEASTLDHVRKAAKAALSRIERGRDPLAERGAWRTAKSVSDLFPLWIAAPSPRGVAKKESTTGEYERLWEAEIQPRLGSKTVASVTPLDVRQVIAEVRATPGERTGKPRVVLANRVAARLRAFFNWCELEGHRPKHSNPVNTKEDVKPEPQQKRALTVAQWHALYGALATAETTGLPVAPALKGKERGKPKTPRASRAKPNARAYVLKQPRGARGSYAREATEVIRPASPVAVAALRFLLLSGWRESEVLTLRWEHIDFTTGQATIDTKTGERVMELDTVHMLPLLKGLPWRQDTGPVFPGRKAGKPLKEIRHLWYAVRHAAGVGHARLHDLRHTVASIALSSGNTLEEVGALLGHQDPASTRRYAKLYSNTVRQAQDRTLSALLGTPVQPPQS